MKSICCSSSLFTPEKTGCQECGLEKPFLNRLVDIDSDSLIPVDLKKKVGLKMDIKTVQEPLLLQCEECHNKISTTMYQYVGRSSLAGNVIDAAKRDESVDPTVLKIALLCQIPPFESDQ